MLTLSTDRVDLWLCTWRDCDNTLFDRYRQVLAAEEVASAERVVFEDDRRRYIATRALTRTVLSRYTNRSPEEWCFRTSSHGRPEVANDGAVERSLSFNLAHSGDLILLGVTLHNQIGVDVETIRAERAWLDVAEQFFARREFASLEAESPSIQTERFFDYWTLKESYIKARGLGLSLALDSFRFDLSIHNRIRLRFADAYDRPERWQFWQWRPITGYVAALCVQCEPGATRSLFVRRIVPLHDESPIEWQPLRRS